MKYFKYNITDTIIRANSWDEEKDKLKAGIYIGFCFLIANDLYISQLSMNDQLQSIYAVDKQALNRLNKPPVKELYENLKSKKDKIFNKWGILNSYSLYYSPAGNLIDFLERHNLDIPEKKELEDDIESIQLSKELNIPINFTSKFGNCN